MSKRILSLVLAVVLVVGCSVGVSAATTTLRGRSVTISDYETPAEDMRGRVNDATTMLFISADGKELGSIAYSDYQAVMREVGTLIQYENGSSLVNPPAGYSDFHSWWADQFNALRGISKDSRQVAADAYSVIVEAEHAATIEAYRLEVVRLVNSERENIGLPVLAVDDVAMAFAQLRATELVTSFSHIRPNGERPMSNDIAILENIQSGGTTPQGAMKSWMNSAGHRANILNSDTYAIGVGAFQTETGAWYWVQIFLW